MTPASVPAPHDQCKAGGYHTRVGGAKGRCIKCGEGYSVPAPGQDNPRREISFVDSRRIWGILVNHAGAVDTDTNWVSFRQWFDEAMKRGDGEYRFMGSLGFGGKFWLHWRQGMKVTCYPEHNTPDRLEAIRRTNYALDGVWGWQCKDPAPGDATSPTQSGAFPEGNDGETGAGQDNPQERLKAKLKCRAETPPFGAHLDQSETILALDLLGALEAARDALRELVELKDGPRDDEYERRKPLAWENARSALDASASTETRPTFPPQDEWSETLR